MASKKLVITIISDISSWINKFIPEFSAFIKKEGHQALTKHNINEIEEGDLVFYLGCSQIVTPEISSLNKHNLVVHESAIPEGKGWSPLTWQILEGKSEIPISLFEAAREIDSGVVYLQDIMKFKGHELVEELRSIQAEFTIKLCREFISRYPEIVKLGKVQQGTSTFYKKRKLESSELDINKSIKEQFDLLRVVDNIRYPAFFEYKNCRYYLSIEKEISAEIIDDKRLDGD
jgi:methionyl-tRNA formyltransferase